MMFNPGKYKKQIIAIAMAICMITGIFPIPRVSADATVSVTPVNLARGKTASASSASNVAYKAVDGIYHADSDQSFWTTDNLGDWGSWWQVDLGEIDCITNVKVQYRGIYLDENGSVYRFQPKSVTFQVSDDGVKWTTVISRSGDVDTFNTWFARNTQNLHTYWLNTSGRYVRLLFEEGTADTVDSSWKLVQLSEVEVYGHKRTSDGEVQVSFNSSKAGQYYYAVAEDGAPVPSIDTSGDGTACAEGKNVLSLTGLSAGAKDVYVAVKDGDGNVSAVLKTDVSIFSGRITGLGGSASASSNSDSAGNAVDGIYHTGNSDNFWETEANQDVGAWWQLDLGDTVYITGVRVEYRAFYWVNDVNLSVSRYVPASVTIQVSDNGTDWRTVRSRSTNRPPVDALVARVDNLYAYSLNTSGRYVRLLFEEGTCDPCEKTIQLTEVEVYGSGSVPNLTAVSANRTSDSEASVTFTSDRAGSYYYAVAEDGAEMPALDTTGAGTVCAEGENSISLTGLNVGEKDIYIKMKDASGNASAVLKADVAAFTPNLALGKTATASSSLAADKAAGKVVDGITVGSDLQNCWSTAGNAEVNAWWQVDLACMAAITDIRVQFRRLSNEYHFAPETITFRVSDDGETWTTAISKSSNVPENGAAYNADYYSYTLNTTGRYVQLQFEDGGKSDALDPGALYIQLVEAQVFGSELDLPVLVAASATRSSYTEAAIRFSSSKAGEYYYAVVEDGAGVPAIDTAVSGTSCTAGETVINLTGLSTGAKDIYIKVKDADGNLSAILKMDVAAFTTNLSLGKSASASSGSSRAGQAIDGIYHADSDQNFWSVENQQDVGSWWQVDLGDTNHITDVKVQYRGIYLNASGSVYRFQPKSVTFQVSNDGTEWTTVISRTENIAPNNTWFARNSRELYSYSLNAEGRYLRLLFEEGTVDLIDSDCKLIQLAEIEVYGNEAIAPTLTAASAGMISGSEAEARFISNEAGRYYYAVVADGAEEPDIDTTGAGITCAAGENLISLTGISAGVKDVYIKVKDGAGNVSEALKMDITPLKPFTVTTNSLERTGGITAAASVALAPDAEAHAGNEVVVFQLMKGSTPVNLVALEKNIISTEAFTAYFNVSDPQDTSYSVRVFVFDRFNSDETVPVGLADRKILD